MLEFIPGNFTNCSVVGQPKADLAVFHNQINCQLNAILLNKTQMHMHLSGLIRFGPYYYTPL